MTDDIIRISDPDQPIYRVFPMWFFEKTLRGKNMTLVHPSIWEDPWEILGSSIEVTQVINGALTSETIIEPFARIFAQCWSETELSDTLLRAYSRVVKDPHVRRNILPREEGVRVRTSARKLLNALETGTREIPEGHCYIGSVQYLSVNDWVDEISKPVYKFGKSVFDQTAYLVNVALLKRKEFSHEAEVRLIFISDYPNLDKKLMRVKIDPNSLFDEVMCDPRLEVFERKERETFIKNLGYTGKIVESPLYESASIYIRLQEHND